MALKPENCFSGASYLNYIGYMQTTWATLQMAYKGNLERLATAEADRNKAMNKLATICPHNKPSYFWIQF